LNKLRKGFIRKETMLFRRFKHGDINAEAEIKQLAQKELELETVAHQLNLHWY